MLGWGTQHPNKIKALLRRHDSSNLSLGKQGNPEGRLSVTANPLKVAAAPRTLCFILKPQMKKSVICKQKPQPVKAPAAGSGGSFRGAVTGWGISPL